MRTDFDFPNKYLIGPVVFRPDFNTPEETISVNQAWSLFFTAGQEDKVFDFNGEAGRFLTYLLLAVSVTGVLGVTLFSHVI
ncbi:hypothetical protein H6G20_11430 [Desertifilum sp. FACHB-1129]|uniref:Uncharacterized protein n=1 Tax=Desertifilum tharense IPPAS B-1220 TaxID=1781255 RepID=A0A1E5QQV6_9CYAN|nr:MULTISPECIES: hypothetical protein [Desertifilum]MDA0210789.1 hypothetical protein [Cyanobacteria bacterium FC1]MBD2312275.1 hypothetical protein [Desertifilum sp. FACHB-1129]MBD2323658.1 hypothetical protein [Desertifilum sp. FACHB-866]MBD2332355.1 hypothetical protein [Desertifilum sp. FACHB-868]OEJ77049.1 hypothetical protein BH720_01030 [Desertifilum tharense IPPAS B-1220]